MQEKPWSPRSSSQPHSKVHVSADRFWACPKALFVSSPEAWGSPVQATSSSLDDCDLGRCQVYFTIPDQLYISRALLSPEVFAPYVVSAEQGFGAESSDVYKESVSIGRKMTI